MCSGMPPLKQGMWVARDDTKCTHLEAGFEVRHLRQLLMPDRPRLRHCIYLLRVRGYGLRGLCAAADFGQPNIQGTSAGI